MDSFFVTQGLRIPDFPGKFGLPVEHGKTVFNGSSPRGASTHKLGNFRIVDYVIAKVVAADMLIRYFRRIPDFRPHPEGSGIDYQLMLPVSEKALGIEYIILWLRELLLENYILSRFEAKAVRSVLLRVCPFYPELIINLCENPLQNAIGLILLQKDPFSLYITHSDRLALTETFASLSKQ